MPMGPVSEDGAKIDSRNVNLDNNVDVFSEYEEEEFLAALEVMLQSQPNTQSQNL